MGIINNYPGALEYQGPRGFLRGISVGYERGKQTLGPDEAARSVEDAKRRAAQEREQKKAKRKFSRGAR